MSSASNAIGQIAPSAKRCIKTRQVRSRDGASGFPVRKHRAPKGALRPSETRDALTFTAKSESTERQTVH